MFSGPKRVMAFKTGHLAKGMNSGIGPSGADNRDFLSGYGMEGNFDFLLNGPVPFLPLPTMEVGTVVFNGHLEIVKLHSGHRKQPRK